LKPIFQDSPRNKLLVVENMAFDASERGEKLSGNGKTMHFCGILTSWWFQPLFEKYWSNWESSPGRDENKKYLKPPPSQDLSLSENFSGFKQW